MDWTEQNAKTVGYTQGENSKRSLTFFCFVILAHRFVQHAQSKWWVDLFVFTSKYPLNVISSKSFFICRLVFLYFVVHNFLFELICRCLIAGAGNWIWSSFFLSLVWFRWMFRCLVSRRPDNPIFILTISLNTEHCCYHCDYTHTQISLKAFKCYRIDLFIE